VNDVWRFLYDMGGKLIAEYGGPQSTDEGGVKYVLFDWQGSTRCVVSNSGNVMARNDYTAFGEEIASGTGLRSVSQGFGSPLSPRQKYGLTERDDATGLDHTWFRKHENQAGRWTGPDPYKGSILLVDPQSFNRYSYVGNDPENFIDPSGLNMEAFTMRVCLRTEDPAHRVCFDVVVHWMDTGGGGTIVGTEPGGGEPNLHFDGCKLKYIDGEGNVVKTWNAYSGKKGTTSADQSKKGLGPIPEGRYTVSPERTTYRYDQVGAISGVPMHPLWALSSGQGAAWGDYRTPIEWVAGPQYGRSGYFIHGGAAPGSAGCIDLVEGNNDFHKWFKQQGKPLTLIVDLKCNPW
jgi:RHS repeat-associated protein